MLHTALVKRYCSAAVLILGTRSLEGACEIYKKGPECHVFFQSQLHENLSKSAL